MNANNNAGSEEQTQLLLLAKKLKMNTDTRRDIFMIIMTSYDINDSFERLTRLDLKGRSDREVVKVIAECCGGEKKYNPFYSELCALLCSQNRQYKVNQFYPHTIYYLYIYLCIYLCIDLNLNDKK